MTRDPLVLALGETQVGTGYARVSDDLLPRLQRHFAIEQIAFAYDPGLGQPPRRIHLLGPASQATECQHLLQIIAQQNPVVLLIAHDLSVAARYRTVLEEIRERVRIVMHCPIDGPTIDSGVVRALLYVHHIVTYTPQQAALLRTHLEHHAARLGSDLRPQVSVIGVGVDTGRFRPHESRRGSALSLLNRNAVRRILCGTDDLQNAFIVLNANRNVLRKRIDLSLEAFANFASRKPSSVMLWLHMAENAYRGWDLSRLTRRPSLAGRIIRYFASRDLPSIPTEKLAMLYNACDVGINTSSAEGWGLVSLEHAATGAAQIVPDHCADLWGENALRIKSYRCLVTDVPQKEEWTIDVQDLENKLELLYQQRDVLAERSLAALLHTQHTQFDWDGIVEQWRALLIEEIRECS